MDSNGIIRRIDDIGRVVIPKELRSQMNLKEGDSVEIVPTEHGIFLSKYPITPKVLAVSEIPDLKGKTKIKVFVNDDTQKIITQEQAENLKAQKREELYYQSEEAKESFFIDYYDCPTDILEFIITNNTDKIEEVKEEFSEFCEELAEDWFNEEYTETEIEI